jgi:hypothetical protein
MIHNFDVVYFEKIYGRGCAGSGTFTFGIQRNKNLCICCLSARILDKDIGVKKHIPHKISTYYYKIIYESTLKWIIPTIEKGIYI